jgi:hypothetical protein
VLRGHPRLRDAGGIPEVVVGVDEHRVCFGLIDTPKLWSGRRLTGATRPEIGRVFELQAVGLLAVTRIHMIV